MRYVLAPAIRRDLVEIAEWIAQDSPSRALATLRAIRTRLDAIAEGPQRYQLRPEIGEYARLAVAGQYVVLFWIDGDHVRFERVVYGGRDLPALFA